MSDEPDVEPWSPPTEAWKQFRYQKDQARLWSMRRSTRFNIVEAPRRCGKTNLALYSGVEDAIRGAEVPRYRIVFGGPTRDHARAIFWDDLLLLTPPWLIKYVSESRLEIRTVHGVLIQVVGLDEPRRIEGTPLHRGYFDEMAEMKLGTFDRHIRPAMSTPGQLGGGWFFGVPRIGHVRGGGKEFKRLADMARDGKHPEFAYHHWGPEDILDAGELESARDSTDPITFAQEYLARRTSISGRAYPDFDRDVHGKERLEYNPRAPLIFCFDFNVSPGVAAVLQHFRFRDSTRPRPDRPEVADEVAGAIGEVHIERASSTPEVCRKLIADWKRHEGPVLCYGDPSGGSRTTKVEGGITDWTTIREFMNLGFPAAPGAGTRISIRGPGTEDAQRPRINSLNYNLRSAAGTIRFLVDRERCPKICEDLEETVVKPGTDGEIWKGQDIPYSHLSDALGYFFLRAHPPGGGSVKSELLR